MFVDVFFRLCRLGWTMRSAFVQTEQLVTILNQTLVSEDFTDIEL